MAGDKEPKKQNFEERCEEILIQAKEAHSHYQAALANLEQTNRIEFTYDQTSRKPNGLVYKPIK